eukprot:5791092-Prymnesium_polylepis.1
MPIALVGYAPALLVYICCGCVPHMRLPPRDRGRRTVTVLRRAANGHAAARHRQAGRRPSGSGSSRSG